MLIFASRIKIVIFITALIFSLKFHGQSIKPGSSQFFDEKFKLEKHSILHEDTSTIMLMKDQSIKIKETKGDTVFIELKSKTEKSSENETLFKTVTPNKQKQFFLLSECQDKISFSDFDISPLVIPLKIRPAIINNPLQFNGDVAIGPYFGYQRGAKSYNQLEMTQTTLTFCLFTSPTMINLNPLNTTSTATTDSVLGVSTGAGILFDLNDFQFGLVSGLDFISGSASKKWSYQGKPWYSFSFAYNLSKN